MGEGMYVVMMLLLLLVGCGGQPDGLFATALTRVNADGGQEAAQEAACCADDAFTVPEAMVDILAPEPQAEVGLDVLMTEAAPDASPDATCWPPGACDCPCYRNKTMDGKCLYDARPNAWVCSGCAPQGCEFEYDAQASLACCPP